MRHLQVLPDVDAQPLLQGVQHLQQRAAHPVGPDLAPAAALVQGHPQRVAGLHVLVRERGRVHQRQLRQLPAVDGVRGGHDGALAGLAEDLAQVDHGHLPWVEGGRGRAGGGACKV